MNEECVHPEDIEAMARAALRRLAGKAWEQGTDGERRLAFLAAEERWYHERAEARLRAYADAAQCHG